MNDLVNGAVGAIVIAVLVVRFGSLVVAPKSDAPRIKRDYESNGGRVLSIKQAGFELGGRSSPSYRKYDVVVRHPVKGRRTYLVGVEASWLGDPELKQYSHWTGH